jgi:hypothetical protein
MTITENYRLTPSSSNLDSITFFEDSETLEVQFKNGSVYQYYEVPNSVWEAFRIAIDSGSSAGKFLNSQIKGVFRYSRV